MTKPNDATRYQDFDLMWAETTKEPVVFKAVGLEVVLPSAAPASIMLELLRLQKEYGDVTDLPPHEIMGLAVSLIGKENVDHLCIKGLSTDQLGDIIGWVMAQYGTSAAKGESEAKNKLPLDEAAETSTS